MKITNKKIEGFYENSKKVNNICWKDEAIKENLIENPKEVLEESLDNPYGIDIQVNDIEKSGKIVLNIFPKPEDANIELTEEELEIVAGGLMASWTLCVVSDNDNNDTTVGNGNDNDNNGSGNG